MFCRAKAVTSICLENIEGGCGLRSRGRVAREAGAGPWHGRRHGVEAGVGARLGTAAGETGVVLM